MGDGAYAIQERLKDFYDNIVTKISESAHFKNFLQTINEKTGIPEPYVVTGLTIFLLLFVILCYGPYVLCDVVVVFYPAYKSFQALEEDSTEDLRIWIRYWVVFGIFHAAEHIANSLFWWLPGYEILKFLFLAWCLAPVDNNGSILIYENYIRPGFQQNTETVDDMAEKIRRLSTYPRR